METALPPEAEAPPVETTHLADRKFSHIAIVIALGFLATSLANPAKLGKLSIQHILKDQMHLSAGQVSAFLFINGIAWYCKPIAGILTDAFPLFRTRRRHYLLLSTMLAALTWVAMAILPNTYGKLLWGTTIVNTFLVMSSTVLGGFLVEAGQRMGATGRLTAIRMLAMNTSALASGPIGGLLAGTAFFVAAGTSAAVVATVAPVTYFFLKEKPQAVANREALINAREQLRIVGRSRTLWWAVMFTGLFYFAPGFATPLYFVQKDGLGFSDQFIGNLSFFSGGGAILAAATYGFIARKLSLRALLVLGAAAAAGTAMLFLFYRGSMQVVGIEAIHGFGTALADLAFIDLAARATPAGCEGLGYSLILSMNNLSSQGADLIGSKLVDAKWSFPALVLLNAGTTALILLFIPLLPKALLRTRDT